MQCRHSKMREYTEQEGVVTEIANGMACIEMKRPSACAACHAQSACAAAGSSPQSVRIACSDPGVRIGDTVRLTGSRRMERQTVLLAFGYPFLLSFATLLTAAYLTHSEIGAGISALAILIPYYIALYFLKDKLKKRFEFSIRKPHS